MCNAPLVVVAGGIAAGKSALAELLAVELDALVLAPDDFGPSGGRRWDELLAALDAHDGPAIVEGCRVPHGLHRRMRERPSFAVVVRAPEWLRERRLRARGESDASVRRLLSESDPAIRPDAEVRAELSRDDPRFARLVAAIREKT